MRTRFLSIIVVLCVLVFLAAAFTGCSSKTEPPEPNQSKTPTTPQPQIQSPEAAQEPAPAPTTTVPKPSDTAVTINGVKVTEGQISALVEPTIERMMARGQQLPPQLLYQYRKTLRQNALERMIMDVLLGEEVKKANLTVTEDEVTSKIDEIAAQQNITTEQFKTLLAQDGQDFDKVRGDVRKGMLYEKVAAAQWEGKINVTEEDAKAFFDENPARYATQEEITARHILIKVDKTGDATKDAEVKATALTKTEGLLKQIKEGADFAELAKANSACGSSARGGVLDPFGRGAMVKPFEDAVFALKVGELSGIVETEYGYHIIEKMAHKEATQPTFEEVKGKVIEMLTRSKQGEIAGQYIESLKAKATIVYPPGKEPAPAQPPSLGPGAIAP